MIGMMWFDNDPKKTLTTKVVEAATRYREKYGAVPQVCMVHPSMLGEGNLQVGKVQVKTMKVVMPGHLWIGVEEL